MKKILILSIMLVIILSSFASANISDKNNKENINIDFELNSNGYYNITALEAWEMLNNSNEKPILIDIRRWGEFVNERIQTPNSKDCPRWFPYEFTSDGPGPIKNQGILLQFFMRIYSDEEIIIYCRTGRRTGISAQILIDNGFTGTVYNMVDGITEWKAIGLPTVEGLQRC
jgi:rhodanese-related sulfurtransferase